jgi:hypothetical protein
MFMWMLHDIALKIANYRNDYVNVTWYCIEDCNYRNDDVNVIIIILLLFLHYILFQRELIKMFMWMLHDILSKRATYQNVYVNVTWCFVLESNLSKCVCECYVIFCFREQLLEMFLCECECECYMILCFRGQLREMFILCECYMILHWRFQTIEWLCECYMMFCFREQLIKMCMWMLRDILF